MKYERGQRRRPPLGRPQETRRWQQFPVLFLSSANGLRQQTCYNLVQ